MLILPNNSVPSISAGCYRLQADPTSKAALDKLDTEEQELYAKMNALNGEEHEDVESEMEEDDNESGSVDDQGSDIIDY